MSAVAADHPPSFTNRVEMMDRIKTLGQEKERVLAEKDTTVVEKNREIAEIRTEKDAVTREKKRISSELEEAQSTIGRLHQSRSIEVEALQIENTDLKADIEHLHAIMINASKEKEYKSDKQRYEKQLEAMEERYLSDRQALEQQHALQLRTIEDEHHRVKLPWNSSIRLSWSLK